IHVTNAKDGLTKEAHKTNDDVPEEEKRPYKCQRQYTLKASLASHMKQHGDDSDAESSNALSVEDSSSDEGLKDDEKMICQTIRAGKLLRRLFSF
ncbi:hypothetical protein PMAYCL1PPCAC_08224, partial [Pristionchus mayeri]